MLLLRLANISLVVTSLGLVASLLISYPLAEHFSLTSQIAAHISTTVIAALLKIGYVTRCVCQYQLGQEVR